MEVSRKAIEIIKKWEGFYAEAYADPGYGWELPTIGIGTIKYRVLANRLGRSNVMKGDVVTLEEAIMELNAELDEIEPRLTKLISVPVTQAMFDALASFCYNCGLGAFEGSTLRRLLNTGDYAGAQAQFDQWVKSNGKTLPGLVNRRNDEEDLFDNDGLPEKPAGNTLSLNSTGELVTKLHGLLTTLGYLGQGSHGDKFTAVTEGAVKWFQGANKLVADGLVGPATWAALERLSEAKNPVKDPKVAEVYRTGKTHTGKWEGLAELHLVIGDQVFKVASGARNKQHFRLPQDARSVPGNLEPLPQGKYSISTISWANGKDSYEGSHGPGLGPVWVALPANFKDDRGAFGFHLDENIDWARGSAGCVVFPNIPELKRFVGALRKYDPHTLNVNWGL